LRSCYRERSCALYFPGTSLKWCRTTHSHPGYPMSPWFFQTLLFMKLCVIMFTHCSLLICWMDWNAWWNILAEKFNIFQVEMIGDEFVGCSVTVGRTRQRCQFRRCSSTLCPPSSIAYRGHSSSTSNSIHTGWVAWRGQHHIQT
jgi:hypothetical protein